MSAHLRVDADLDRLSDVRRFVREQVTAAAAPAECLDDVVQAVDEAATNVINHGYRGTGGWLEVDVDIADGRCVITLEDAAPTFDPHGRAGAGPGDPAPRPPSRRHGHPPDPGIDRRVQLSTATGRRQHTDDDPLVGSRTQEGGLDGAEHLDRGGDRASPDHDHGPGRRARRLELRAASRKTCRACTRRAHAISCST